MNLLSIDWDYFCPPHPSACRHWRLFEVNEGSGLAPTVMDALWTERAVCLFRAGLPLTALAGDPAAFWDRFRFTPRCRLYLMESHQHAADPELRRLVRRGDQVWNFDAHHDCGYRGDVWQIVAQAEPSCEDWMLFYGLRLAELHVRYPAWRAANPTDQQSLWEHEAALDDGQAPGVRFGAVVLARSDAWTPPWLDQRFERFLAAAPMGFERIGPPLRARGWNWGVEQEARAMAAGRSRTECAPLGLTTNHKP